MSILFFENDCPNKFVNTYKKKSFLNVFPSEERSVFILNNIHIIYIE